MLGPVAIVGPGRMGLTLASALVNSGDVPRVTLYGRHPEAPAHPVFESPNVDYVFGLAAMDEGTQAVLLAVPDECVPDVAQALALQGPVPDGRAAFHLSGALSTDVLDPLFHRGYAVGALHPLLSVASPLSSVQGSFATVTGSPEAVLTARRLAEAIGVEVVSVSSSRRAMCDAAVEMASSQMIPVLLRSVGLMERAGMPPDDAVLALLALIRSTLDSVEAGGIAAARHGAIARGDYEMVALHLRALDPEDQEWYSFLGAEVLRLAGGAMRADVRDALAELFTRHAHLETPTGSY